VRCLDLRIPAQPRWRRLGLAVGFHFIGLPRRGPKDVGPLSATEATAETRFVIMFTDGPPRPVSRGLHRAPTEQGAKVLGGFLSYCRCRADRNSEWIRDPKDSPECGTTLENITNVTAVKSSTAIKPFISPPTIGNPAGLRKARTLHELNNGWPARAEMVCFRSEEATGTEPKCG
jgi:hypothetical protein